MSTEQEIRFRVVMDDAGVEPASRRTEASVNAVKQAVERSGVAMLKFGKDGQATAHQLQALSYQTTDIVTQLAGGQNPFLIMLQQGGQLRDQFGGVGNVFRAVGQVLTVARVAAFGFAGALGAMAYGAYQGYEEQSKLNKSIALTGNQSILTAGQVGTMARGIADATHTSIGNARELLSGLIETGAVSANNLEGAGRAAAAFQRISGAGAADVVKQFASMRDGAAQWSLAQNKSYNYLSVEQYKYIRTLESQGRTQEAVRLSLELFSQSMESRAVPALGALDRVLESSANAWSKFWDGVKGIGRDETIDEQIAYAKKLVDHMDKLRRLDPALRDKPRDRTDAERELDDLRKLKARTLLNGSEIAVAKQTNGEAIERASRAFVDAQFGVVQAGNARTLAEEQDSLTRRFFLSESSYRRLETSAQAHQDAVIEIERSRIAAEERFAKQAVAIERGRVTEKPADELRKTQAIIDAQNKLIGISTRRAELENKIVRGQFDVTPIDVFNTPRDQANLFDKQSYAGTDQFINDSKAQRQNAASELLNINRQLSIELIQDEGARGRAVIAEDERQLRIRLDLDARSADDRKEIEDRLAIWRVSRQQQLTEQLKPEWQKMVDAWSDVGRQFQKTSDEFLNGFTTRGRDAFVEFATTGRVSVKGLVQFVQAEFAKMVYERFLAQGAASLGKSIFGAVFGGGGGGGLGSFIGGLFGGSGYSVDTSGAGTIVDAVVRGTRGGAATGSNYVERDMLTILHKGEAVIPAAYNPAAGGAGVGAGGGITFNQVFNVASGASRADMVAAAQAGRQAAVADVADLIRRGNPAFA